MVAIQQVGIVPPWLGGGDIPRIMDDATLPVLPLPPLPLPLLPRYSQIINREKAPLGSCRLPTQLWQIQELLHACQH